MSNRLYYFLIILIVAIGIFIRFYNFENRLIFGPEQAISLLTSAANLEKFSLLGEYNLQRQTSTGLNLIHGPLFSYSLLPLLLLFNFQVLPVTIIFALLNLLSGLILLFITGRLFGRIVALLTFFFFMVSSLMVYHSLFIWIYHPLILLGVLSIWFVARLKEFPDRLSPAFCLGLISGIGFSLQYPFLLTGVFLFFLAILLSKRKLQSTSLFVFAFLLANVTRVVFDLRHDFFHLRVFWQYFLDVYVNKTIGGQLYPYHYLQFFPFLCLILALVSTGLYRQGKILLALPILIFLFLNLSSPLLNLNRSLGMPSGLTLRSLETAAETIAVDQPPERFNVATLWDFDTRAHPLRYLLTYYYGKKPAPVEDYRDVSTLYVFAPETYDIDQPKVWELRTFLPYKITELTSPATGYRLVKLTK